MDVENTEQLITVKLSKDLLRKIFLKNWELIDKETREMLIVSGIVEVSPNVRI